MSALLSIILSFAMLFSGGALPATAKNANTLTLQDICIEYDGESYPLGFDLAFTAAPAQEELILHFEAQAEDETLLPLSGRITPDGVEFVLSATGSKYSLSAETLDQLAGLDAAPESLEFLTQYLDAYTRLLKLAEDAQNNPLPPETQQAIMDALYAQMQNRTTEETELDIGSGAMPATRVAGKLSIMDLFAVLDGWMALDDPMLSEALTCVLDMYNSILTTTELSAQVENVLIDTNAASIGVIGGADGPTAVYVAGEKPEAAESFTDLISRLAGDALPQLEQLYLDMEIITAQADGTEYAAVTMLMDLYEEAGMAVSYNVESILTPEGGDAYISLYVDQENVQSIGMEALATIEGPMNAPQAVNMEMMMQTSSVTDLSQYQEAAEELLYYGTNTAYATYAADLSDGLQNGQMHMQISNSSQSYADGELSDETLSETAFDCSLSESLDESGNKCSAYVISATNGEQSFGLSFNTLISTAPVQDYFSGRSAVELSADAETDPGYQTLKIDALQLSSDAMRIAANEDFLRLQELLTVEAEADSEIVYPDKEEDSDYGEYAYESYGEETEMSFEEAAALYLGTIPDYTAPEGYILDYCSVGEEHDYLYMSYSRGDDYFDLSLYHEPDFAARDYLMVDGSLNELAGYIVELEMYDDVYGYASINLPDGEMEFSFDYDADLEEVQTILAGLK